MFLLYSYQIPSRNFDPLENATFLVRLTCIFLASGVMQALMSLYFKSNQCFFASLKDYDGPYYLSVYSGNEKKKMALNTPDRNTAAGSRQLFVSCLPALKRHFQEKCLLYSQDNLKMSHTE